MFTSIAMIGLLVNGSICPLPRLNNLNCVSLEFIALAIRHVTHE